jgi:hypothetical protein
MKVMINILCRAVDTNDPKWKKTLTEVLVLKRGEIFQEWKKDYI